MNTTDKLKKLVSLCKCEVSLDINSHTSYYQSVKDYVQERIDREQWDADEVSPECLAKMIELNTIIELQFYPRTPICFGSITGYDLDLVLDSALENRKKAET